MKTLLIVSILAFTSCTGSGRPEPSQIYSNKPDGYSVGHPDGWSTSDDRGAIRFAPSTGKQTIVVKAVLKPSEIVEGKSTTDEDVVEATRRVLQRMARHEKLGAPTRVANSELPGARFSLTYVPPSARTPYQRTHVVLMGAKRVFHVIQTAPVGEKLDEQAMSDMVSTLTEEG